MISSIDARKTAPKFVPKTWGHELHFANDVNNNYCGKILHINSGCKFSMHYHLEKIETFFVLVGTVKIRLIDTATAKIEEGILKAGDIFEITRGLPHQLEAIDGDAEVIEASTYSSDDDSYRVWR